MRNIIRAWLQEFVDDDVLMTIPAADSARFAAEWPSVEVVPLSTRPHGFANIVEVPVRLRGRSIDHYLAMNFTPWRLPSTTLLLDVLFQSHPTWFSRAERTYFKGMTLSAPWARTVATISQNEARRIRRLNPRLDRVVNVGLAIDSSLANVIPVPPSVVSESLADSTGFYLCVGRLNTRKNLVSAIEGAIGSGQLGDGWVLFVVGERDGVAPTLSSVAKQAVSDGRVVFLGGVTDPELSWLYRHAAALIFLSLDEGFGLPPVEALTLGCPVIVSDIPVFRETLGDNALYVDPTDVERVSAAIASNSGSNQRSVGVSEFDSWGDVVQRLRGLMSNH